MDRKASKEDSDEGRTAPLELRVAAFTALREEIARRSNAQVTFIGISLAAFTALASVAVSAEPARHELVLLVPLVSGCAGMLWLDHHTRIMQIGAYILRQIFDGAPGSFEEKARERAQNEWLTGVLGFLVPTVVVFAGPASAALAWTDVVGVDSRYPWLWKSAAGFTLAYAGALIWVLSARYFARHE